ncbi:MAG: arylesterase [Pseudomonadota bacterium]
MSDINFTQDSRRWFQLGLLALFAWVFVSLSPQTVRAETKPVQPPLVSEEQAVDEKADRARIVVLGDSLSAGYRLAPEEAFPVKLQKALDERGVAVTIIGAGVSGDTTSGGLARLNWSVPEDADGVLIELGANDALRGLPPATTRSNLEAMITKLKERSIDVLLTGMLAPPNLGDQYAKEFNVIYADLAEKHDVLLYPFFLDGVVADPNLNLEDGIHPTAEGIDVIVSRILPMVERFVERLRPSP